MRRERQGKGAVHPGIPKRSVGEEEIKGKLE
jgi:hypothetical protein